MFSTRICAPEIHRAFPRELFRTARKQSELHQELFPDSCGTSIKRIRRVNSVCPNAPNNEQVEVYFVSSLAASSSNKCFKTLTEESFVFDKTEDSCCRLAYRDFSDYLAYLELAF